jgi:hypothetical protein
MAQAKTTQWEHAYFSGSKCDKEGCKSEVRHNKFYYPTYMNGDAECLSSLCEEHYKPIRNKRNRKRRNKEKNLIKDNK